MTIREAATRAIEGHDVAIESPSYDTRLNALFKELTLSTVLWRECGVERDPARRQG